MFRRLRLISAALYVHRYVIQPHESALTRRMRCNTETSTHPRTRRVSWSQSAQTATRDAGFAILRMTAQIGIRTNGSLVFPNKLFTKVTEQGKFQKEDRTGQVAG